VSTNCIGFQTYEECQAPQGAAEHREVIKFPLRPAARRGAYSPIPQTDGVLSGSAFLGYNPPIQFPTFPSLPIFYPATIPR